MSPSGRVFGVWDVVQGQMTHIRLGKIQKGCRDVLKNRARRREFLSDPAPRIHFEHISKHSSWLNQTELVFGVVIRKVMRGGDFDTVADREQKRQSFVSYFNQTKACSMNWIYSVRPTRLQPVAKF